MAPGHEQYLERQLARLHKPVSGHYHVLPLAVLFSLTVWVIR